MAIKSVTGIDPLDNGVTLRYYRIADRHESVDGKSSSIALVGYVTEAMRDLEKRERLQYESAMAERAAAQTEYLEAIEAHNVRLLAGPQQDEPFWPPHPPTEPVLDVIQAPRARHVPDGTVQLRISSANYQKGMTFDALYALVLQDQMFEGWRSDEPA